MMLEITSYRSGVESLSLDLSPLLCGNKYLPLTHSHPRLATTVTVGDISAAHALLRSGLASGSLETSFVLRL